MQLTKLLLLTLCVIFASSNVSAKRMLGYWSLANGYANQPGCAPILTPDRIPAELYTHIIFSFAFITPEFTVAEPTNESIAFYQQVQAMKQRNPDLLTIISLGGWSMNMSLYSNAVATPAGRTTLVQSIMTFLRKWNWDGIDFDWEYPADPDRGGKPEDPRNFQLFVAEMRRAVDAETVPAGKSKLELSIALPGGPFHGQNYLMGEMIQDLDYANIMAYNLHGPWEPLVYCSANFYDGTPTTSPYHGYSIYDAIEYFLNQNGQQLPADKFNLGVTFAGVEFTLANPSQNTPGSPANGQGLGGACTKEAGYMAYFEIESVIANGTTLVTQPAFDSVGHCKYFVHSNNQWVGYDDAETLADKVGLVNKMGLGGISVWAMYAESATGPVLQTAIHNALGNVGVETEESSSGVVLSSSLFIYVSVLIYLIL